MGIKIEVQDSQRKHFEEFLVTREQALLQQIQELDAELSSIRKTIESLKSVNGVNAEPSHTTGVVDKPSEVYNKEWTQIQKVQFLMRKFRRPVGTGELADMMIRDYEPDLDRVKAVGAISAVLTNKTGKSKFARSTNDRNAFVYSLIEYR